MAMRNRLMNFFFLCLFFMSASPALCLDSQKSAWWDVSGKIFPYGKVEFNPLFTVPLDSAKERAAMEVATKGLSLNCKGDYALEVQDASGKVLYTCHFITATGFEEKVDPATHRVDYVSSEAASFSGAIPVKKDAAVFVVKNPENIELGRFSLLQKGIPPDVLIVNPSVTFIGKGKQAIEWKVNTVSPNFTSKVFFSKDGGNKWDQLQSWKNLKNITSLAEDFDNMPGTNNAQIRVLVSDGLNTGVATSSYFSIPRKNHIDVNMESPYDHMEVSQPTAEGSESTQAKPVKVLLMCTVISKDEGSLEGNALEWKSSLQGTLGRERRFAVQLVPGRHIITLRATDTQGNVAEVSHEVTVLPCKDCTPAHQQIDEKFQSGATGRRE